MALTQEIIYHEIFALIYGETQVGKSTFVNAILEEKVAEQGGGRGQSVTTTPTVHSKKYTTDIDNGIMNAIKILMMDTPGNLDTLLRWSDEAILNNIKFAITSASGLSQIDVIFLAESLTSDSVQLQRNLQKLKNLFGDKVMKSIVVLGLKPQMSIRIFEDNRRIEAVQNLCQQLKLPLMIYESRKGHNWNNNQFKEFMGKLFDKSIAPYKMSEIDEVRKKIEVRAQELMVQAPIQYKTVDYTVEVDKLKEYQVPETYWVSEYQGKGSRRYGFAGPREDIYKNVQKTRMVTKYKPYKEMENRTRQDEIPKNIDKYRFDAKREWEQQMKSSIQIHVNFQ